MVVDYFLIRRGNIDLAALFTTAPYSRYYYTAGINLRAYAAFVIGFILPLPGFVASFGYTIGAAASDMYALGWILSFLMGCLLYFVVRLIWEVPGDDKNFSFGSKVSLDISSIVEDIHLEHDFAVAGEEIETGKGDEKHARISKSVV